MGQRIKRRLCDEVRGIMLSIKSRDHVLTRASHLGHFGKNLSAKRYMYLVFAPTSLRSSFSFLTYHQFDGRLDSRRDPWTPLQLRRVVFLL